MSNFEWDEFSHQQYFKQLQERIRQEEQQKKLEAALPKKFIGSGEDVCLYQSEEYFQ